MRELMVEGLLTFHCGDRLWQTHLCYDDYNTDNIEATVLFKFAGKTLTFKAIKVGKIGSISILPKRGIYKSCSP